MTQRLHAVALVTAAAALLVVPTIGQAHNGPAGHNTHANHGQSPHGKSCAQQRTVNKGFVVTGVVEQYTADTTPGADGATDSTIVEIKVTNANRHARITESENWTDTNLAKRGVQVAGNTYTADANTDKDGFRLQLSGYDATEQPADTPSVGDKVRVLGKVPVTRKRCDRTASLADRYGNENIRKVKIIDGDPDPVPVIPAI